MTYGWAIIPHLNFLENDLGHRPLLFVYGDDTYAPNTNSIPHLNLLQTDLSIPKTHLCLLQTHPGVPETRKEGIADTGDVRSCCLCCDHLVVLHGADRLLKAEGLR